MTKRKRIRTSLITSTIVFSLLMGISLGVVGFLTFHDGIYERYQTYIDSLLKMTIAEIDGDDLQKCVESKTTDEKYDMIQAYIDNIKNNSEIEYIYMVKPLNLNESDNLMYVMTGLSDYEKEHDPNPTLLGYLSGTEYSQKVAEYYMDSMNGENETTYYDNTTDFGYMYTGMRPILNSEGKPVCVLAIDISMDNVKKAINKFIIIVSFFTIIITAIFVFMLTKWLRRRIVSPIERLEKAATEFCESSKVAEEPDDLVYNKPDFNNNNDEICSLADKIQTMYEDLKHYMKNLVSQTREKERIASELNVATDIQASMLPSIFPAFPDRKEIDIYATMNPAKEVGGDFYDFFLVDEENIAIVMADVSGKGVPAALFMVIAKTLIKDHTNNCNDPGAVFSEVNDILCESNSEGMFVTAFEGILNLKTGRLLCVNAGHEMPFITNENGEYKPYKIKPAFVLAGMEGMQYKYVELQLNKGDKLFQYTDGVTEATNVRNELYGMERLEAILNKNKDKTPAELLPEIKADIDKFVGDAPQFDDITMLCVEFLGNEE